MRAVWPEAVRASISADPSDSFALFNRIAHFAGSVSAVGLLWATPPGLTSRLATREFDFQGPSYVFRSSTNLSLRI